MTVARVKRVLREGTTFLDKKAARVGSHFERPALVVFLFHAVFETEAEIHSGLIHPQEATTKQAFRHFLDHFLNAGYRFVSLSEVENGLDANGKYGCITFDDGYANNLRILDTLREYEVPATVFVATANVAEGKRFWWDTIYSERSLRGASSNAIDREIDSLKSWTFSAIEAYIEREFGAGANAPRADLDRPLTPHELKVLASDERISIGNHTMDHAILTTLDPVQIRAQIVGAQRYLEDIIGTNVRTISYPNGNYDPTVLQITRDAALSCGVTGTRRKESVPVPHDRLLELGRFQFAQGINLEQMRLVRSEVQLTRAVRLLRNRIRAA